MTFRSTGKRASRLNRQARRSKLSASDWPLELRAGRIILALSIFALGLQCLLTSQFILGLEPAPDTFIKPWAWASGIVLMGIGVDLLIPVARASGRLLAALLLLSTVVLHGPLLVTDVRADADDALHTLAIAIAAILLAVNLSPRRGGADTTADASPWIVRIGLACFGLCTVGHGVMHFVFFKFTADFVPSWMPAHNFLAAATGAAQIAAGIAIVTGVLARPAAALTGAMYGSWVLIVHIPRVFSHLSSASEWSSVFIAACLSASALIAAGTIRARRARSLPWG